MMVLAPVFPYLATTYEIERVVTTPKEIIVEGRSRRRTAVCPRCAEPSRHVPSYSVRHLWEQPCAGRPVQLILTVQRFGCANVRCPGSTFAEPLDDLAQRHAQRTMAQGQAVQAALTLPWRNGPVEGQITRLKLLKRQGYGRASVDLLRRRLLASG